MYILSFLLCFSLLFSTICKTSSDNHFAFLHFFSFGMILFTTSCTMLRTSVHSSSATLSYLIPWIYLSLPLYSHQGFDLWPTASPYFFQFESEFCNKELMIWDTVSSRSCFCWLFRAFPSSCAKNIINLDFRHAYTKKYPSFIWNSVFFHTTWHMGS